MDNPRPTPPALPASPAPPPSPAPPVAAAPPGPFKDLSDFFQTLKGLPRPITDDDRAAVVARIKDSSQKFQIAFEILWLIQDPKLAPRFQWLEPAMLDLLGSGEEDPDLAAKSVPSEAKTWVYREFREVKNLGDWKRFVASGRHLWVLYAILKAFPNKQILVEALSALSECAEQCQNWGADGKQKKVAVQASDPKWIAKLIKARIPTKLELPKAFLESLYAITATAELSEALRKESNGLHFRLKETEDDLTKEKQAEKSAEERADSLQAKLTAATDELQTTRKELAEERLHNTRQGGFNVVAKNETIKHVLALVRQGAVHRLENIRLYADRENPDREEIVALVGEIEKHLSKIEEVARQ